MATRRPWRRRRSRRIDQSVARALDRWRHRPLAVSPGTLEPTPAFAETKAVRAASATTRPRYNASVIRISLRLLVWIWAGLRFYTGVAQDKVAGRDTLARRALRLRKIFEGLGPTFIKVAQQLSVRADLLAIEYCQELSKMLDSVPPFPTALARKAVEHAIGAPLAEVFEQFDPQPIGSASVACVYKAQLHNGQSVAVKVRRPGVVVRLAADVYALGWLLQLAEWLGLFRTGFTRTLRTEFARMLFEELDFLREARNTELFREEASRAGRTYIRAPRVHFAFCAEDVLVTDFVNGVFLTQILRALDNGDVAELERIRELGIDLHEVARRLTLTAHWELLESLLFHADPHPANICIQPGNLLVFLDFGSCGCLDGKYRRIWQRFYRELSGQDIQEMVQAALAILEPLPPIDVESFLREVELMFWDWIYAMNSEHSVWWEKASGLLWMKFANAARLYQAPMSSEIVRIFRATFLYDTTIFRLWDQLDMREEFRRYQRQAGKREKRRMRRAFWSRVENGLKNSDYIQIADMCHMGKQFLDRVQHYLDEPKPEFARDIGKLSYGISTILRLAVIGLAAYLCAVIAFAAYSLATGQRPSIYSTLVSAASNQWCQVALATLALLVLRKAIQKSDEIDSDT
jgi:predicted unusual protein kinase regulating ubiquinone biosynthesis (AarF/ABC1/UbiB family)